MGFKVPSMVPSMVITRTIKPHGAMTVFDKTLSAVAHWLNSSSVGLMAAESYEARKFLLASSLRY